MKCKSLKSGFYRFYCQGGYFEIYLIKDENHPGVNVEYVSYDEKQYFDKCPEIYHSWPRVLFEKCSGKLRAVAWADPRSEDYSDAIEFDRPQYIGDMFDAWEKSDLLPVYQTIDVGDSEEKRHDGKPFTVVRRVTLDECDPDAMPMWRIRFDDGFETSAFPEEIYEQKK